MLKRRRGERIAQRNRAVLHHEYERLILQFLHEIGMVKCFPGLDSKENRQGIVKRVTLRKKEEKGILPLCTDSLMRSIEEKIKKYSSPFAVVDVVNPEYEDITMFCGLKLKKGYPAGVALNEVRTKIINCIAPWIYTSE